MNPNKTVGAGAGERGVPGEEHEVLCGEGGHHQEGRCR